MTNTFSETKIRIVDYTNPKIYVRSWVKKKRSKIEQIFISVEHVELISNSARFIYMSKYLIKLSIQ